MSSPEKVNHPRHYGGDVPYEVIKVLEAWLGPEGFKAWLAGTIIKYIPRANKKGSEIEDWNKVLWYTRYMVAMLEDRQAGRSRPGDSETKHETVPPKMISCGFDNHDTASGTMVCRRCGMSAREIAAEAREAV